jgi:hypothetical protein
MPMLKPSLLKSAEQAHLTHHVVLEAGTTLEDVLKPEYWKAAAAHLHPSDRIQVEAADGSFFAELSVRDVGKTWAKVKPCYVTPQDPDEGEDQDAWQQSYQIGVRQHKGGICVLRNSDNAVVAGPFENQNEAVFAARNLHRR